MSDLRQLVTDYTLRADLNKNNVYGPLPIRVTDDFPSYFNTQLQVLYQLPESRTQVGVLWDHVSTGARVAYQDYSGGFRSDILVSAEAIGFLYEGQWPLTSRLSVLPSLQAQVAFTTMTIEDRVEVGNETSSAQYEWTAVGVGLTPQLSLAYRRFPFALSLDAGYHWSTAGAFRTAATSAPLSNSEQEVQPRWDGLRAGVTLGLALGEPWSLSDYDDALKDDLIHRIPGENAFSSYYMVDQQLYTKFRHLRPLLLQTEDRQIKQYYYSHQGYQVMSTVMGGVGGFLMGWSIGRLVVDHSFNDVSFATGVSSAVVGVLLKQLAGRQAKRAIKRYNQLVRQ